MPDNVPAENGTVSIGSAGEVSLQKLQQIYHELTGKSEELSKQYDLGFRISIEELEQLHLRFKQTLGQYNLQALNCAVTVYFEDDTRQLFSSFEIFKAMNAASTSCTHSVVINYKFLVVQPSTNKAQNYDVEIRLSSRVAEEKKNKESSNVFMKFFLRNSPIAWVTIKYVDYTIARTCLDNIDRWIHSCPHKKCPSWLIRVKKRSYWIPIGLQYAVGLFATLAAWRAIPDYLPPESGEAQGVAYLLISFVAIYGLFRLAMHLGRAIEQSIDDYWIISYISLTTGDKNLITQAEESRNRGVVAGAVAFVLVCLEALLTSYVVKLTFESLGL